jgi:hypothetical protein
MPDLTIETAATCATNEDWETTVPSSDGKSTYTVRFGRLYGRDALRQMCQNGYTCTCQGFKIRGTCKHVTAVEKSGKRCGWNAALEPFVKPREDGKCPCCGGEVTYHRVGV